MRSLFLALLFALSVVLLSACSDGSVERERAAREAAEQAARIAEQTAREAQQGTATWQTVAFIVGIAAVVLLVFGTALGSSARKHAERRKERIDREPR